MREFEGLPWADFKILWDKLETGHEVFEYPKTSSPNTYWLYFATGTFIASCLVEESADVTAYETSYQAGATSATSRDGARALALLSITIPLSKTKSQIVEIATPVGAPGAQTVTVVTHDYTRPITWYQNSTRVGYGEGDPVDDGEELTPEGGSLTPGTTTYFSAVNDTWVNTDHPKLQFDQTFNVAYFQTLDPADYYYLGPWAKDGTKLPVHYYRPIIEVDPIGDGTWQVAAANDTTYGHLIDYENGRVYFTDTTSWNASCKVRASYHWVDTSTPAKAALASVFECGPPTGYRWLLPITEVQLPKGARWNDSVWLTGTQGGFAGSQTPYHSYDAMLATATGFGRVFDGQTTSPTTLPPTAENGWPWAASGNAYDGFRNPDKEIDTIRWQYQKAYDIWASLANTLKVYLGSGVPFDNTGNCAVTVSYYFNATPE